ncbi:hypothetical protein R5O20_02710 [Tenacibaculum maritimum]|uniref:hypothetical protein n=1 Tax=Tenacibaculum maritimum TaxID=107401 RepID=UPI0038906A73
MSKKTKIKFLKDYSPRKEGEVKELEEKLAEFYLNNGIAELADEYTVDNGGCEDCNKSKQTVEELAKANEALEIKTNELNESNLKTTDLESQLTAKNEELAKANEALEAANKSLVELQKKLEAKNKK